MNKKASGKLVFMDLDGTITRRDTMFAFLRHCYPGMNYYTRLLQTAPMLLLNRLGLYPSAQAKELLLTKFFRGYNREDFEQKGNEFARSVLPKLIRKRAKSEIEMHRNDNATIVIVTASLAVWCRDWCKQNGLELIATQHEVRNNMVTGKLLGRNCKGKEKVRQIKEKYLPGSAGKIYAYGDTKSDMYMLELADIKYYKWRKTQ